MSFDSDNALPKSFSGVVRLFPLPNVVIYPGVIQALHIFEPRYVKMIEDAIDSDSLITMALPIADTNQDLQLSPDLYPSVCIGKIITHNKQEDGRFNLLLMGVQRARIVSETASDEPYRVAQVEVIPDSCSGTVAQIDQARKDLVDRFRKHAKSVGKFDEEMIANLSNSELPFGMLVDLICFSIGQSTEFKVKMLAEPDTWNRYQSLVQLFDSNVDPLQDSARRQFPPDFSAN